MERRLFCVKRILSFHDDLCSAHITAQLTLNQNARLSSGKLAQKQAGPPKCVAVLHKKLVFLEAMNIIKEGHVGCSCCV